MILRGLVKGSALLLSAALLLLSGCSFGDSKLLATCEAEVKARLLAPAGYHRIEAKEYSEDMTIEAWMAASMAADPTMKGVYDVDAAAMKRDGKTPKKLSAFITYDAPNAYGTPIRGVSACEYLTVDGQVDDNAKYEIQVDQLTHLQWYRKQLGLPS